MSRENNQTQTVCVSDTYIIVGLVCAGTTAEEDEPAEKSGYVVPKKVSSQTLASVISIRPL